jgi:peptidoglycan/xylan/chitin deacetylase (PgdA/CDA1 family)
MSDSAYGLLYFALTGGLTAICLLFFACYATYSVLVERRQDRVPVLLYHRLIAKQNRHRVEDENIDRAYAIFDTDFAAQMDYLHRSGYSTISLDEFIAYQKDGQPLPPKPIIITFDDGFASNYFHAFPVLKKHRMTAIIFVTPDTESENFKKYAASDAPLTISQMKEMSENGIAIQSHAMTHRYLTELDPETIRWELAESKRVIEENAGKKVSYLAIPSGAYNRTVKKLAKETGYTAVFCMLKGTNNKYSDRFGLRRLVVGQDFSIDDFRRMLRPETAAYLRVESFLQNALFVLLGPARLDALRDFLYRSCSGSLLTAGKTKYWLSGFAALCAIAFAGLLIFLSRPS